MTSITEQFKVALPEGSSPSGRWSIEKFDVVPSLGSLYYALQGRPVDPGTYTRLMRGKTVVMSDTPAEIYDALDFYLATKAICDVQSNRRVLIHGLGMGCTIKMALEAGAESIDVVEIDKELIDFIMPHYPNPRITVHHHDCLSKAWPPNTKWSVVWHDIWDTICDDNLPDMKRLHRRFGSRTQWQGSWARELLGRWS